jgi:RND family efflux transporter MFP subunit
MTPTGSRPFFWIAVGAVAAGLAIFLALRVVGLVPATGNGAPGGPAAAGEKPALHHCPMHPTMTSDRPGPCPICGMQMVPVQALDPAAPPDTADGAAEPAGAGAGHGSIRGAATTVEGHAPVSIPARKQQLIGIRTGPVSRTPFVRKIRAVGRVTPDETRLHHVHTKIEGWIETLHVNATGERVRKGQPLLELYSPELVASQEEYLLALRSRAAARGGTLPGLPQSGDDLVESARRRLLLYDLAPAQIAELETTGRPARTATLYAPISGYVTQRNVTQGEKIDSNSTLLDIADLSRVWIIASVYEYELPFVRVGQTAAVALSYLPGRTFSGRVTLVYPVLEESTRTVQVRLEFDNPDLALKPEMYADVIIESDLGERLALPESAVLASGTRNVVFVARGEGYFEPREVRLGVRLPEFVEVLEGVAEGDRVVTSGTFFVDSESKLKAALEAAGAGWRP